MAATTSKPSPSNRPVDETVDSIADKSCTSTGVEDNANDDDDRCNEFPPAEATAVAVEELSSPTYLSVESSEVYLLAKRHLSDGNFEEALTVIEEGIRDTKAQLAKLAGNDNEDDFAMHESIAPFHYLCGSTLLYSIEESDQEVTTAGSAVSTAVVSGGEAASSVAAMPTSDDDEPANDDDEEEENNKLTAADAAEDMEVACETRKLLALSSRECSPQKSWSLIWHRST